MLGKPGPGHSSIRGVAAVEAKGHSEPQGCPPISWPHPLTSQVMSATTGTLETALSLAASSRPFRGMTQETPQELWEPCPCGHCPQEWPGRPAPRTQW